MLKRLKLIYRDHRYLQGEISLYLFLEMFWGTARGHWF